MESYRRALAVVVDEDNDCSTAGQRNSMIVADEREHAHCLLHDEPQSQPEDEKWCHEEQQDAKATALLLSREVANRPRRRASIIEFGAA